MVIDLRRDHSIRIPRPDLSVSLGTPNACSDCHRQKSAAWAAEQLEQWYGHQPQGFQHFANAFAQAEQGAAAAGASLAALAGDRSNPDIVRSSALEGLAHYPARASVEAAHGALADPDALVRRASISTLDMLPPAQRLPLIAPLLDDPVRIVRLEAAATLADSSSAASTEQRAAFDRAAADYELAQRFNADRPESRAALGNFYLREGRTQEAEAQLRSALELDPAFAPAYVNLADLQRTQARDADAEQPAARRAAAGASSRRAALHPGLDAGAAGTPRRCARRTSRGGTTRARRRTLRLCVCGEFEFRG